MLRRNRNSIILSTLILSLYTSVEGLAQPYNYSQALLDPTSNYSAMSGYHGAIQMNGRSRLQWPGIPSTYWTYGVTADFSLNKIKSGVGLSFVDDRAGSGISKNQYLKLNFGKRFKLTESMTLLTGLDAQAIRSNLEWNRLTFGDMIDARYGFIYPTAQIPIEEPRYGYGAGVSAGIHRKEGTLILAALNLSTRESYFRRQAPETGRRFNVYAAHRFILNDVVSITPSGTYEVWNEFRMIIGNVNVQFWNFSLGAGYRSSDALIFQAGYQIADRFLISYSYDMTVSRLGTQTLGSHEWGIRATLNKKKAKDVLIEDLWVL